MEDFFEIDFLKAGNKKSCDAIPVRYRINDKTRIHVTDGGFQDTGDLIIEHMKEHYGAQSKLNAVVVTHPDGDHAGGVRKLLEEYEVEELWMLRPWKYADELIDRFSRFQNVENLAKRLKEVYPNIAALEEIAEEKGIDIFEPMQGAEIGAFRVMAPTKERYLDLIVESEKTPEGTKEAQISIAEEAARILGKMTVEAVRRLKAALWGEEYFPEEGTSSENEMSVVQYASLCGEKVLLTGDAGRSALMEAADYAESIGIVLPGIDRVQVPHHGSRHNVSVEVLDRWLGEKLKEKPEKGKGSFSAIISAAEDDDDHPRKAVIRGFMHRGANVITTEKGSKCTGRNAPQREGWVTAIPVEYPEEQEED